LKEPKILLSIISAVRIGVSTEQTGERSAIGTSSALRRSFCS